MYETIKYEIKKQVAWITLNRTDKLNAFNEQMNKELQRAFKDAFISKEIRAVVLTGEGRAFCSGQDLEGIDETVDHGEFLRKRYGPMLLQLEKCEKPVIAALNGVAAGAGLSLALACDFRLASEKASIIQAFIHVGLIPDAGNLYYLPRLVGHAKAMELAVLGEKITATQAYDLGLVTKVIPVDLWQEEVSSFAERLACMPTKAIGLIKRNLKASWQLPLNEYLKKEAEGQRIAGLTTDHQEGVSAFMEKRKPQFQGY